VNRGCGLPSEFELIAQYFAPLAKGFPGAYGLLDDAAVIAPAAGHELVAKTDAIVGGVHFYRMTRPISSLARRCASIFPISPRRAPPPAPTCSILYCQTRSARRGSQASRMASPRTKLNIVST
jgi:hypothetical protein